MVLLHFRLLNNNSFLVDIDSRQDLQSVHLSLRGPLKRLSTRLDNELDINLKLSINLILYVIILSVSSFLLGAEKVTYFSVFCPSTPNCPLNSSASSLIIK